MPQRGEWFRPGEWAVLVMVMDLPEVLPCGGLGLDRECFLVEFGDGVTTFWPVDDTDAGYEFMFAEACD